MPYILGISAFYHDAAAAIVIDGQVVAAAQEERFTRIRHTAAFPENAIRYCLQTTGLCLDDLDAVVFYDKPLLKFERLLQTYYAFAPKGLLSFLQAMPIWLKDKIFLKKTIRDGLAGIAPYNRKRLRLLFTEHHLAHAASAFYVSPFPSAAILTIDGVGEWGTASIGIGDRASIRMLKEMRFPHSVGLLYSAFTYFLGFAVNSGEYKVMGLAAYGHAGDPQTLRFIELIKTHLADIKPDGSLWLNQQWFTYTTGLRMLRTGKWQHLFGIRARTPDSPLEQCHCNLALAVQTVIEEVMLKMAAEAKHLTGANALCMAGGVALNCVANGKIQRSGLFTDIFIQPAAGDAGGALGAALAAHYLYFGEPRVVHPGLDGMQGTFLGPEFSKREIEQCNRRHRADSQYYPDFEVLCDEIARRIAAGQVVGWFQGRMEFGPRALGARSILADARRSDMQHKINRTVKFRENFRPFAPAMLLEDITQYVELNVPSPYMLLVSQVCRERRKPLPDGYDEFSLWDRLGIAKSDIPAVTHADGSARVQSVDRDRHPRFYALLTAFKRLTGYGLLLNTSFNVRGEPVVCTPDDAYRCFMDTEMDCLVMENFVYDKSLQPGRDDRTKWKRTFQSD